MAPTQFICTNLPSCNSFRNKSFHSFRPYGSSSFTPNFQFRSRPSIKAMALDSSSGKKQMEIVYDIDERLNKFGDEVDKNAPLSRLTLFSPCKINVFLRITSKRADGFHDLASLFHVISLGDIIKFSLSPSKTKDRLSTNAPGVPLDEKNLIIKALNLYRQKTGTDNFFWIHLDKKVPTGAGLGGGSSNAATALWAANQFNGCLATEKELQEWSSEIGSDVPFFFSQGAAYCTGRGEIVEDIPPPTSLDVPMVLIKPQQACATAEVYKRLRLDQTSKVDPLTLLEKISSEGISQNVCVNDLGMKPLRLVNEPPSRLGLADYHIDVGGDASETHAYKIAFTSIMNQKNPVFAVLEVDYEPPAFEVLPSLRRLKQRIMASNRGEYDAVFMSGSGSTIIGIGSPDPPQFIYDEEDYRDVFLSEANFMTREENQWYLEPASVTARSPPADFPQ